MWMIFRENYYCKNDLALMKQITRTCHLCCLGKYKNYKNQNTVESIVVKELKQIVAMDYLYLYLYETNVRSGTMTNVKYILK